MGIYKLSQVSFNTESFTLAAGNREIYIGPLATKLLFYMLEHSGKTLSRDNLAYSVWGYPAKDHTITQAITSLRSHLSTLDKDASRCIVTVPKKGYRLRLDNGTKTEKDYTPQYFRPSAMKFLVVDDHPFIRKVHSELLVQLESAAVDTCASAETALERLNSVSYDCVFADLEMENMNGLELVKRIRMGKMKKTLRDAYTFVITAHTNAKVLGTALLLDVNAFLPKPADITDLRKKFSTLSMTEFEYKPPIAYDMVDTHIENYFDNANFEHLRQKHAERVME